MNQPTVIDRFLVEVGGKYGFIDRGGRLVIAPEFDDAHPFGTALPSPQPLAPTWSQEKDKTCFVDPDGKVVLKVPSAYSLVDSFIEGLAQFHRGLDKTGFLGVDRGFFGGLKLKQVIAADYDGALSFSEGLAVVKVNGKCGYIDRHGSMVISPNWQRADSFSHGRAAVEVQTEIDGWNVRLYQYINKVGKMELPPQYLEAGMFSSGLAPVVIATKWDANQALQPKRVFINQSGVVAIDQQFSSVRRFSEGLAMVCRDGKYGYIDEIGRMVIEPRFSTPPEHGPMSSLCEFTNGLAWVCDSENGGYIDREGKFVWKVSA